MTNIFTFKTKNPITEEQKKAIQEGANRFNKEYYESMGAKIAHAYNHGKISQKVIERIGWLLEPTQMKNFITNISFAEKEITIELNKDWVDFYDLFSFGLGRLFGKKENTPPRLPQSLLRKALKDYVELVD